MKILIAEDDIVSRFALQKILQQWGYEVEAAPDGPTAWEKFQSNDYRIVISDWVMPGFDGPELVRRIRAERPEDFIYIILLTLKSGKIDLIRGMEAGSDDFISKPFHQDELRVRLRAAERIIRLERSLAQRNDELQEANRRLAEVALTDALTDLPNRRHAMQHLQRLWSKAIRNNLALSCLMIDVDHFKRINDTYGHDVGDFVLRELGYLLSRSVRACDVVCRMGGEEFLVICEETDLGEAERVAQRVREHVVEHPPRNETFTAPVTVSIGVATRDEAMEKPEALLKSADLAVYAAKRAGRNRVCVDAPLISQAPN